MVEKQHQGNKTNDILIVDDERANLQLLSNLLDKEGHQVRPTNSPLQAIESAILQLPKLILLDIKMPQMDGFEVCRRLKDDPRTKDLPRRGSQTKLSFS